MSIIRKNRWMSAKALRLSELMKMIPDDEFVIIFDEKTGDDGFREEDALYNGLVADWWKEEAAVANVMKMSVLGFQARELETVVGPVIMIVVDF